MHQSDVPCYRRNHTDIRSRQHFVLLFPLSVLLWSLAANAQQASGPTPNRRPASVQWANRWYLQGGYSSGFLNSFHSLDLSDSWSTALPPWTTLASGTAGSHFGLVATQDGRIWSVGGNPKPSLLSVYDPSSGQWQELTHSVPLYPRGIEGHAAFVVPGDDKIYIIGGFSNTTGISSTSLAFTPNLITVFDTTANSFVPPGPTEAQTGTTSWTDMGWAWISKKRVALFFGGTRTLPGGGDIVPIGVLQQFVPWLNEWSTITPAGTEYQDQRVHFYHVLNFLDADGSKVVVFGGTDGATYLSDM